MLSAIKLIVSNKKRRTKMSNFIKIKDENNCEVIVNTNSIDCVREELFDKQKAYLLQMGTYLIFISKESYDKLSNSFLNRNING